MTTTANTPLQGDSPSWDSKIGGQWIAAFVATLCLHIPLLILSLLMPCLQKTRANRKARHQQRGSDVIGDLPVSWKKSFHWPSVRWSILIPSISLIPYTVIGFIGVSHQIQDEVEKCKYLSYLLSIIFLPVSCTLRVAILLFLRLVKHGIARDSQKLQSSQPRARWFKPWAVSIFLLLAYCVVMTIVKTFMDWYVAGGTSTAMSLSSRLVLLIDAASSMCIDFAMLVCTFVFLRGRVPSKSRFAKTLIALAVSLIAPIAALVRLVFVSMLKYDDGDENYDLLRTNLWTNIETAFGLIAILFLWIVSIYKSTNPRYPMREQSTVNSLSPYMAPSSLRGHTSTRKHLRPFSFGSAFQGNLGRSVQTVITAGRTKSPRISGTDWARIRGENTSFRSLDGRYHGILKTSRIDVSPEITVERKT